MGVILALALLGVASSAITVISASAAQARHRLPPGHAAEPRAVSKPARKPIERKAPAGRLKSVVAHWLAPRVSGDYRSGSRLPRSVSTPTPPFTQCPAIGADTGCGLLLEVTNAGVTVLEDPTQGPYDGSDDTLVGVVNESSTSLANVSLESSNAIFEFDGDGICSGFYGALAGCPFGPTGYEGPETSFVQISSGLTSGAVSFTGGLAPSATAYFSLEAPLTATSVASPRYVALGDSVAAGEGIGYGWYWNVLTHQWEGGSTNGTWDETFEPEQCHQTTDGYPHIVAFELNASLSDFACTGASAFNGVLGERVENGSFFGLFGHWTAPAQLGSSIGLPGSAPPNPEYDAANPGLVSLTLGADDVNFAEIVSQCYENGCSTDPHRLDSVLAAQEANLELVIEEIHRRGVADGLVPLTIATEYYNPFPAYDTHCVDLHFGSIWNLGPYWISNNEMQFLIKGLQRLNHNIAAVAARNHILVLNTDKLFEHHRFCSIDEPWVYGPSIDVDNLPHKSAAPFHPTPEGQRALGDALAQLASNKLPVSAGSNVHVGLPYGQLNFANLVTAGEAAIIPAAQLPGSVPSSNTFAMVAGYVITTSADYSGPITVSLPATSPLSLYHYEGGQWQEVPSSFDGTYVSGAVSSLSPFALGTPVSPVHARLAPVTGDEAPATVAFDASGSSVEDGSPIASYEWEFGDEGTATGASPSHVYAASGTYTVTVTVTAEDGAVDTASEEVTITHAPPRAVLAGPTSGAVGQTLGFDATGSSARGGPLVGALWGFGDGSEAVSGATVHHAYAAAGTYQVTLTVRDEEGGADTVALPVTITAGGGGASTAGGGASNGVLSNNTAKHARISIGRTLSRDRRGRIVATLHCGAGTGACTGSLRLRTLRHGKLAVLGSVKYSIGANRTAKVNVAVAKHLARVARTSALNVNVLAVESGGLAVTTHARLAAPAKHATHHS